MNSLAIAWSTLEVCLVWTFTPITRDRGLRIGSMEANRWHQPDIVICVLEGGHKTVFSPDWTPSLIIEVRRMLGAVM
ncbi:hypothetical protein [Halostagnicola sp. A56]|uniref:hypothetical protein n=1 Tax=Halostagnicola sp. A56 TaxID=1495067 RepID=UPI0012E25167|nr:hypothetical protein [Halostagnicola sp. A56]